MNTFITVVKIVGVALAIAFIAELFIWLGWIGIIALGVAVFLVGGNIKTGGK